ncbi:43kDa postsynaptic protein [Trema orientale]|uniref:43kDa postsynaptic protein n=1 Tax=Trema orientale TaxID=63057 RepID=A0A2P5DPQ4_TREOI|nr:43kDa postsynaptic protein [Trema orientale]
MLLAIVVATSVDTRRIEEIESHGLDDRRSGFLNQNMSLPAVFGLIGGMMLSMILVGICYRRCTHTSTELLHFAAPALEHAPHTETAVELTITIDSFSVSSFPCEEQTTFGVDCPICLEEFTAGESVRIANCGHLFHTECVHSMLGAHKRRCPCCNINF